MDKKRILIFSLAYYPHIGGAEIAVKEITDRILWNEIEFHMVTLRFSPNDKVKERIGNIVVHRIGYGSNYLSKILFIPLAAFTARRLLNTMHFEALWAMMTYMVLPIVLLRFLGDRTPYVLTLQDGDPFEYVFNRWFILPLRPLLHYGFRHALVIQTISTFLATWAKQLGYQGPLEVIPNAVDIAHFGQPVSEEGLQEAKRELGKRTGDIFLVTTSRLVHKNGIDTVIRALKAMPERVKFIIFGEGEKELEYQKLARELGVERRVQFRGKIGHQKMPRYLRACDIFVRPSRSEGMGNSFIEAMVVGLPVIATQEGGIADFLFDAKLNPEKPATGWAVRKDDPQGIVRAVEDILAHKDKVRSTCENARMLAVSTYDWNLVARDMNEKVFKRALD